MSTPSATHRDPEPERGAAAARRTGRAVQVTLEAHDLCLAYGAHVAVEAASIPLEAGRVTALIGPNGSGKSTLLRAMAGLHRAQSGTITFTQRSGALRHSRDISLIAARDFARQVALFTQSRPAVDGLSVLDIVQFGRHPHRKAFAGLDDSDREAVRVALELTGVTSMADRSAGALSGGELQRVWLAVCLAQDTGVLLLDEPTNHLDLRYQMETLALITELAERRGTAIGVVLHDLDHAARVADTVAVMDRGRVRALGAPTEVLTADLLSEVYEIPIEVRVEQPGGRLRIDPVVGRARSRADS